MTMDQIGKENTRQRTLLESNLLEGECLHPSYLDDFNLDTKNDLPKISVIIPTYNRSPHSTKSSNPLSWCLESLLTQKGDCLDEIIIVDDASVDYTKDVVEGIQQISSIPIVYLKNKRNMGSSISRNLAVSKSRNNQVMFLDDDCVASRNMLFGASFTLNNLDNSTVAVQLPVYHRRTSPKLVSIKDIGILSLEEGVVLANFDGFPVEYIKELEKNFFDQELKILKPVKINNLGGVFLIKKGPFMEVGGFPEFFTWRNGYREETDIALRLSERSYEMVFTPDPKFYCVHLRYGASTEEEEECSEPGLRSLIEQSNIPRRDTGNRVGPEEWFYSFIIGTYTTLARKSIQAANKFKYNMKKNFVVGNNLKVTGIENTIGDVRERIKIFDRAIKEGDDKLTSIKTTNLL